MAITNTLTAVEKTEFDSYVKAQYQYKSEALRKSVYTKANVNGGTMMFEKIGQVIALPSGYNDDADIQDGDFSEVPCVLAKYRAPVLVDDIQQLTVSFDAKMNLAKIVGYAMSRRTTQIVLNALINSGTSNVIVNGGTNMTYDKVLAAVYELDNQAVDPEDRYCAIAAQSSAALLKVEQFTNMFYRDKGAVLRGTLDGMNNLGFNWNVIPTMLEGGLPIDTLVRSNYFWHKYSTGLAVGSDIKTRIDYIPKSDNWLIQGIFFGNAVAIENTGIVQVDTLEVATS